MKIRFDLTGITALLMHNDDFESSDLLNAWRKAPANKGISVAGDDRSPALRSQFGDEFVSEIVAAWR